jgi:hypothetical protein
MDINQNGQSGATISLLTRNINERKTNKHYLPLDSGCACCNAGSLRCLLVFLSLMLRVNSDIVVLLYPRTVLFAPQDLDIFTCKLYGTAIMDINQNAMLSTFGLWLRLL